MGDATAAARVAKMRRIASRAIVDSARRSVTKPMPPLSTSHGADGSGFGNPAGEYDMRAETPRRMIGGLLNWFSRIWTEDAEEQ